MDAVEASKKIEFIAKNIQRWDREKCNKAAHGLTLHYITATSCNCNRTAFLIQASETNNYVSQKSLRVRPDFRQLLKSIPHLICTYILSEQDYIRANHILIIRIVLGKWRKLLILIHGKKNLNWQIYHCSPAKIVQCHWQRQHRSIHAIKLRPHAHGRIMPVYLFRDLIRGYIIPLISYWGIQRYHPLDAYGKTLRHVWFLHRASPFMALLCVWGLSPGQMSIKI